jgi:hypothetical protein
LPDLVKLEPRKREFHGARGRSREEQAGSRAMKSVDSPISPATATG